MIELNNISFAKYFDLEDKSEYDYAIKYAYKFNMPVDNLEIGDFMKLPFGIVKDIQYDLLQGLNWEQIVDYIKAIKGKYYPDESLLNMCQQRKYILSEIERINEIESIALSHDSSDEEIRAGIDDFDSLGNYLQLRELTGGDVTKNELVRSTIYEDCFVELVTRKKLHDYEKRYMKLVNDKYIK